MQNTKSKLVYYERPDADGPKLSKYSICEVSDEKGLNNVLTSALGTKGVVKKSRQLFLVGQTRVHVDSVEGLGDFMELEVGTIPCILSVVFLLCCVFINYVL